MSLEKFQVSEAWHCGIIDIGNLLQGNSFQSKNDLVRAGILAAGGDIYVASGSEYTGTDEVCLYWVS